MTNERKVQFKKIPTQFVEAFRATLWNLRDEDLLVYQKTCVQVQYLLFKWPDKTEERNFEPNGAAGFFEDRTSKKYINYSSMNYQKPIFVWHNI